MSYIYPIHVCSAGGGQAICLSVCECPPLFNQLQQLYPGYLAREYFCSQIITNEDITVYLYFFQEKSFGNEQTLEVRVKSDLYYYNI